MGTDAIDLQEVAVAIEEMFLASHELGEAKPDMDMIVDILQEQFPGITLDHVREASLLLPWYQSGRA